uniref:Uncharacterized protein n=1 Tax=Hucho hucho TaxID=62062 RepID=A0A4W5RLV6_9TELE
VCFVSRDCSLQCLLKHSIFFLFSSAFSNPSLFSLLPLSLCPGGEGHYCSSGSRDDWKVIPAISSLSWFTTVVPLVLVLSVTAAKDATDDINRHRSDKEVNNRKVTVLVDGE